MELRDIRSKEEFPNFYREHGLDTLKDKIKFLEEEMGILWSTGDFTPEENLATLELHCLVGWDRVPCRKKEGNDMLTKKKLADFIIKDFIYSSDMEEENLIENGEINYKKLNSFVPQCTTLGIALEFMGKLDDEYKDYIADRAGTTIFPDLWESGYIKKIMKDGNLTREEQDNLIYEFSITVRKLFNLLPD